MGIEKLDIAYEKRLTDLLGYDIVGPDNSNRWIIIDKDKPVGFIQYKKLHKYGKKNPAIYGYCTEIDSSTITWNVVRNSDAGSSFTNRYKFDVKTENDDVTHLELLFGDAPQIHAYGKNRLIHFFINRGELSLNFKSNSEEAFINYSTDIEWRYRFGYDLITFDKETNTELSHLSIGVNTDKRLMRKNQVEVREMYIINNSPREDYFNIVNGTVEEAALNNDMALKSLNNFRELIGELLPFTENIFDILVTDEIIESNGSKMKAFFDAAHKIENKSLKKH